MDMHEEHESFSPRLTTALHDELVKLRHQLHRQAEVSGKEEQTAETIEQFVRRWEPAQVITKMGGHGLAAVFEGCADGPTVLIRAELDGLPIDEELAIDHRSQHAGASHKCGHDGHMTMVAALAPLLHEKPVDRGRVVLLFQPAEEIGQGARWVLDDEKYKSLRPDYVFALHNLPGYGKGAIVVRRGVFAAGSVGLIVELQGATSHAAEPQEGKSPALAVAALIEQLSALPQFHTALYEAAKVTVVHVKLGEVAFGTSPGMATVAATLRAYEQDVLARLKQCCVEKIQALAAAHDLTVRHRWTEEFPPTVNDDSCVERIERTARALDLPLRPREIPFPWSEDFGNFTMAHKGAMFGLGSGVDQPALHHPTYDFPDALLAKGIAMFESIVRRIGEADSAAP
jgi:amidohydrolase